MTGRWILFLLGFTFLPTEWSSAQQASITEALRREGAKALAADARERGDAVRGAVLFPKQELKCFQCHALGAPNLLGPDLTRWAMDKPDEYLVDAVLFPSKDIHEDYRTQQFLLETDQVLSGRLVQEDSKQVVLRLNDEERRLVTIERSQVVQQQASSVSAMPDDLIDQLASRQQFLDLIRYLIELRDEAGRSSAVEMPAESIASIDAELVRGWALIDELGCAACHDMGSPSLALPPKHAPLLHRSSELVQSRYLYDFLLSPQKTKPGTAMPEILHALDPEQREQAATELVQYISSLSASKQSTSSQRVDVTAAERGGELFHAIGCVACHSPRSQDGTESLADESIALGQLGPKYTVDSLATFLKAPHVVRPAGRMPDFQLTHWEAVDLANYLIGDSRSELAAKPIPVDQSLVERGRKGFVDHGCGNCHQVEDRQTHLANLSERTSDRSAPTHIPIRAESLRAGCLSDVDGAWPKYSFDSQQKDLLRYALGRRDQELSSEEQIALSLTAMNCIACHTRGSLGGVSEARDPHFQTTNPNLGPQGRIPPTLDGVGAKLQPKWLRQVLVSGRSIRPYMKTRMPKFGAPNVQHLVDLFEATDELASIDEVSFDDQKLMRTTGHTLVGSDGLNCIACHTYQLKSTATMPAADLTEMHERLQRDWFFQYMRSPQRFSPGTVMPSFWPGGRAIRPEVFDGDVEQQLEAIWQYLRDGRQARAPKGLIRERLELLATDEAVMLRRSYPGVGKRGIGVGYPSGMNVVFDAEQMRMAMIWRGRFADPGGVWRSQGHGNVQPLERERVQFLSGPELIDLDNPWSVDQGRPREHHFKGYELDTLRRPSFHYMFQDVEVWDYSQGVVTERADGEPLHTLIRRLTFRTPQPRKNLVFRIGTKEKINKLSEKQFAFGQELNLVVQGDQEPKVASLEEGYFLTIPLALNAGQTELVLEYSW